MKAWKKGAIVGFVSGFIYWTYVVITKILYYDQPTKYSVALYSFFYGVILAGVSLGLLVFILDRWKNRPVTLMFGALWGIFSGVLLGIGLSESGRSLYSLDMGTVFLYFPAWISFLFLKVFEKEILLPENIGFPFVFLILVTMGIVSCGILVDLAFSIGYRISKLISKVKNKKGLDSEVEARI